MNIHFLKSYGHYRWIFVGSRGNWTTSGCKLESDNNGVITCSCNHLTNFAVLLVSNRTVQATL